MAGKGKKRRRWFGRLRRSGRRRKDRRLPILPTVAAASTLFMPCPSGRTIWGDITKGDFEGLMYDARERYLGIDNTGAFKWDWLVTTYLPLAVGIVASKLAGRFVNPTLDRIPLIGRYIKL